MDTGSRLPHPTGRVAHCCLTCHSSLRRETDCAANLWVLPFAICNPDGLKTSFPSRVNFKSKGWLYSSLVYFPLNESKCQTAQCFRHGIFRTRCKGTWNVYIIILQFEPENFKERKKIRRCAMNIWEIKSKQRKFTSCSHVYNEVPPFLVTFVYSRGNSYQVLCSKKVWI